MKVDPADQAVARPRSADAILKLLKHKNWIRTADIRRAVRPTERAEFEKAVEMLQTIHFVERRELADGHGTELRLATTSERPIRTSIEMAEYRLVRAFDGRTRRQR